MDKVLLTGVMGPHGNLQFDLVGDRLTKDQDIFTLTSHAHFQALHFIAHNISAECVVLEHPREEDLIAELARGYAFLARAASGTHKGVPGGLQVPGLYQKPTYSDARSRDP